MRNTLPELVTLTYAIQMDSKKYWSVFQIKTESSKEVFIKNASRILYYVKNAKERRNSEKGWNVKNRGISADETIALFDVKLKSLLSSVATVVRDTKCVTNCLILQLNSVTNCTE